MTRSDDIKNVLLILFLLFVFALAAISGCGSITPASPDAQDLGASVDDSRTTVPGNPESGEKMTDSMGLDAADTHSQIVDAGASLPICPAAITHPDCPQPKCDCQDR